MVGSAYAKIQLLLDVTLLGGYETVVTSSRSTKTFVIVIFGDVPNIPPSQEEVLGERCGGPHRVISHLRVE